MPEARPLGADTVTDSSTPNSATYPPASAGVATRTGFEPDAGGHSASTVAGVPEALMAVIDEVTATYEKMRTDDSYLGELDRLQRDYTGRPSPLYEATRLREDAGGAGSSSSAGPQPHRLAQDQQRAGTGAARGAYGKTRVIAETGAGQHGVATATACALLGLECLIYMGRVDTERQALNVARMRLLGAEVVAVETGSATLKDAINEALRDWVTNAHNTYYCFGTAAGRTRSR